MRQNYPIWRWNSKSLAFLFQVLRSWHCRSEKINWTSRISWCSAEHAPFHLKFTSENFPLGTEKTFCCEISSKHSEADEIDWTVCADGINKNGITKQSAHVPRELSCLEIQNALHDYMYAFVDTNCHAVEEKPRSSQRNYIYYAERCAQTKLALFRSGSVWHRRLWRYPILKGIINEMVFPGFSLTIENWNEMKFSSSCEVNEIAQFKFPRHDVLVYVSLSSLSFIYNRIFWGNFYNWSHVGLLNNWF